MGVYKLSGAGGLLTPRVNYTSMLAGNEAFVESAYELIATTVLEAAAPSVVFNNLENYSSTYKHLQIRIVARTTRSGENADSTFLRINGDVGSNYNSHNTFGNGISALSSVDPDKTSIRMYRLTASTSAANAFGAIVVDLLDTYSTTKNKTIRYTGGATSGNFIYLGSGVRLNTEAVSNITLTATNGNLVAGSRFSIYGIRG